MPKAEPRPRLYYGWVLVLTLGITQTITWGILYYGFAVFMPVLEAEFGWSRGAMSGAFALATLLSGICAAPVGHWLDTRGPRLLMSAGSVAAVLLLHALALLVLTLIQAWWVGRVVGAQPEPEPPRSGALSTGGIGIDGVGSDTGGKMSLKAVP